jgi:hypothetical protein
MGGEFTMNCDDPRVKWVFVAQHGTRPAAHHVNLKEQTAEDAGDRGGLRMTDIN